MIPQDMLQGLSRLGVARKRQDTLGSSNIAGWKIDPLKMYFLLNMGIFYCYVSLPEGNLNLPTRTPGCGFLVTTRMTTETFIGNRKIPILSLHLCNFRWGEVDPQNLTHNMLKTIPLGNLVFF